MTIGMTTTTKYAAGFALASALLAMAGTKMFKGHFCWLCIAGVTLSGAAVGYYVGKKKSTPAV